MFRFVVFFVLAMSIGAASGCQHRRPHNIPVGLEGLFYGLHCMPGGKIKPPYSCQPCPYYDYRRDRWKKRVHGCSYRTLVSEADRGVEAPVPAVDVEQPVDTD